MPLVKNTLTGNNYLVKINTDGDACSRTAIRSYNKQYGSGGLDSRTTFYLPFNYEPSSHTLWVFVNGEKAVVEQIATTNRQYEEINNKSVRFGTSLQINDVLEFIVAGSYLNDTEVGGAGGGLTWVLTDDSDIYVSNDMGYLVDTTSNSAIFNLPANPLEGDTFAVVDAFGNFETNNATLHRLNPSHNIQNINSDFIFDKDGMAAQFVFDGVSNWVIVNDHGFVSGVDGWEIISTGQTAILGKRYMADTSGGAFSVQCPTSPEMNDEFTVSDYTGSFYTNNLTITQNGERIMGINDDLVLNVSDVTVKFVYIGATQGWRIVTISS